METTPYALGLAILIILAGAVGLAFKNKDTANRIASITTFADCVAAGYPVMESYPEQCRTPDGRNFVNAIATTTNDEKPTVASMIRVQNPLPNQTIESGFQLKGEARGNWYFEASFPAKIVDANGKIVAQFPVSADGEWMTTEFVPFAQTVTFQTPETSTGTLVLERDNPSGLPENDAQLVIPVRFATSSKETSTVKVFFSNASMAGAQNTDCSKVYSVFRTIPKTSTTGKASIEELLKGPSVSESNNGYATNINPGVKLNSLTVTDGVARADFNSALDSNVAGACLVTAIRSQIEETLKQFAAVKQVVISVNGKSDDVLQP